MEPKATAEEGVSINGVPTKAPARVSRSGQAAGGTLQMERPLVTATGAPRLSCAANAPGELVKPKAIKTMRYALGGPNRRRRRRHGQGPVLARRRAVQGIGLVGTGVKAGATMTRGTARGAWKARQTTSSAIAARRRIQAWRLEMGIGRAMSRTSRGRRSSQALSRIAMAVACFSVWLRLRWTRRPPRC